MNSVLGVEWEQRGCEEQNILFEQEAGLYIHDPRIDDSKVTQYSNRCSTGEVVAVNIS